MHCITAELEYNHKYGNITHVISSLSLPVKHFLKPCTIQGVATNKHSTFTMYYVHLQFYIKVITANHHECVYSFMPNFVVIMNVKMVLV